ncbi:sensor histidine kinase [Thermaerobacillus caldiproteolyticus]|uniref:sensor histidine kinase n=1 Tax=Thermaerobacillus caldiproteolyticus TaxID=247480 RepID=UPI001889DE88|nr:HAMP domain-containing sensor histidine kinase [Anoxybacillus caldiproteolyticus]QPA32853.1 HAMP domain-containing histidine kinase [Anoxybacillus caldiproteolyticus]
MKNISFKIGLLFLVFIVLIETVLFFTLYVHVVESRVKEELNALQARGNSHRAVLEKHYGQSTIDHVALMESEADTDVAITDEKKHILAYSNRLQPEMKRIIRHSSAQVPREGKIIESHWKTEKYIAAISPIRLHHHTVGYVYMFQPTESIKEMIWRINHLFMLVGALSLLATIFTIFLLSRIVASPLIHMKEATERLSRGDFSVHLHVKSNDELGALAKAIQLLSRDLAHLKKTRSEFLASISHELRTPLTYVKGYADIVRRKELSEEERIKYATIIYEEANHVAALVKELFDLAQLEQHSFSIQKEAVKLYPFIQRVADKMALAFQEKGIHFEYRCPSSLSLQIDPNRFEQVLVNVLDNALKYSKRGGHVRLDVEEKSKHVLITVADEGIGIPEEDVPFVFERFYRVDKSRARSSGGSGLGLSIVKEIVEAHGGTVKLESKVNKGTMITIELERDIEQ